jgi:DHA3 family macrolide efflux protein-like MFS transporter
MQEFTGTVNPERVEYPGWQKKTALFMISQGLSLFGSMLVQYAIIWYVTLSTQSGAALTISTLVGFLPQLVISLFAGVWADRYPRKLLIIGADLLTASSTLVLAIFFMMGYQELWLIYVVSGIRSIGAGVQSPAVNALLPQIVPPERLVKVNSLFGTIHPFIMIVTPVLAGTLMSFSRLEAIFFIDVVTALLAVSLLVVLKVAVHQKAAQAQLTGYLDDLKSGLVYIAGNRTIRTLFIFFSVTFFLVTPIAFLSPLMVTRSFGDEVWKLTANEVTFFLGSIVGGAIMMAWGGFKSHFRTIGFACILWSVLVTSAGLSTNLIVYLIMMFLLGIPMPMFNVPTTSLLQEIVSQDMQGRVFGVQQMIMSAVMPLGMLVFGPVADVISIELLLVISGAGMALPGLWIFFKRLPVLLPASRPQVERVQTGD